MVEKVKAEINKEGCRGCCWGYRCEKVTGCNVVKASCGCYNGLASAQVYYDVKPVETFKN